MTDFICILDQKLFISIFIMPEGPEVHIIVDQLGPKLIGRYLLSIRWDTKSKYKNGMTMYDDLSRHLPVQIKDVTCKGKQIFFKLNSEYVVDDEQYTCNFYINCTLGMEGRWTEEPTKHCNLWFELGDVIKGENVKISVFEDNLYFDDSRHFGNITILTESDYENKLRSIGPDLISDDIDTKEWLSKANYSRIKNKQICHYLMEQKYFSGIGNYLKSEILYAAKIRPDRVMSDLSENELITILECAKYKIKESYQSNGLTIRSYISPNGELGTFVRFVYGKEMDPHGNTVVQTVFKDKRTTHWVPSIQI
jgi:formamidopyrimidine-DNA glycosylase